MNGEMMSLADAAANLGYHPSTLRKIVNRTKQGERGPQIQFFQVGSGRIKFKQEWLDDFVLANSVEPGQVVPAKKQRRDRRTAIGDPIEINYQWGISV